MCGWIKINRSLLDWEWFGNAEMIQLLVYLIFKANIEDKKWQGIIVKRGQLVTSVATISADLGLTSQKVRTCLDRLRQSETISIKTTNRFSLITICNYVRYQDFSDLAQQTNNKQITNKQQTNNKQITTTKEYNNINIINNNDDNNACVRACEEEFSTELKQDQMWLEVMAKNHDLQSTQVVADWLDKFDIDNQCRDKSHTDLSDYRRHFNDWLKFKKRNESTKKNKRDGYYEPTATSADDYYNSSF